MRTQETTDKKVLGLSLNQTPISTLMPASQSYHEMSDVPVREIDPVEQLEANLHQLEDLQQRLQFMMREIRYIMKV